MPYKDKEKQKVCRRKWYENHKEIEMERNKKRRYQQKKWLFEFKKKLKCEKCGFKNSYCLQFHHPKKDTKNDDISSMVHNGCSVKTLLREISKCEILCANCHLKEHANKRKTEIGY